MRTEDGYIIRKCLDGDSAAFGILVDKYKGGIYALAYSRLRNFHDAEDVTQEVFIKAYEKLRMLRRWDNFHAWLYAITFNLCKDWVRSRAKRPDREFIEDKDPKILEISSLNSYREKHANQALSESVRAALDSLPEMHREVLTLFYLSGMSGREIARFLGTSPNTIRQRLHRARARLRAETLAVMSANFQEQRLSARFTIRIVEVVKRIKIHPAPRTAGLPWGLPLAAGIILAVLSFSKTPSVLESANSTLGSPLPSEMRVLKRGEIPVDMVKISEKLAISSKQGDGDSGDGKSLSPQASVFMAPDGEITFTDVAREAGLIDFRRYNSMAPVWGDYDNDGDLDLYVTHGHWNKWVMEQDVFYRNNGDGTFTDATTISGLTENRGDNDHAGFLDYDNDGNPDLYVYNSTNADDRILIYHNNGDGTFTDVTVEAGISLEPGVYWSATYADYNNDGYLDIYVTRHRSPNRFFENNGDGTFTDQTERAGVGDANGCVNVTSGDYDNDGDMDIYLSNGSGAAEFAPIVLYRNNGDGTFTDVAEEAGVAEERKGRCVAFFDYNNDGNLDIFAAGVQKTPIRLYHNNGDGTFTDVAREAGVLISGNNERLAVGDYDNDGYMDIYMMGTLRMLYHNNGDGTFTDKAKEVGVQDTSDYKYKSGGCSFADYDSDGDLDIYAANIGLSDALFRNDGNDNHWLHIKLVGTESNRDGVGARVTVKAGELSMIREINPGCSRGYNPLIAYFGLGQHTRADSVEIRWPTGPVIGEEGVVIPGRIEVFENVSADRFIMITEGSGEIVEIARAVHPQEKLPGTWGKVKLSKLYQNYPNPFNPETWIPYQLAKDSSVVIKIRSSSGQLVRTLELGDKPADLYTEKAKAAYWDGNNDSGEAVASGVYFYTIQTAENYTATRKMVVAR